jgi:hypothetical protein
MKMHEISIAGIMKPHAKIPNKQYSCNIPDFLEVNSFNPRRSNG